jgi:hypothetical protein
VGSEWLPPLLWTGDTPDEIPFDTLEPPYILKWNHLCGENRTVTGNATLEREETREALRSGLGHCHGSAMREPAYVPIRRQLLAEKLMLEPDGSPPIEHKVFVFDGRAQVIWTVVLDRDRTRYDAVHTCDWRPLNWRAYNQKYAGRLPRPDKLETFLELAERLGAGLDHLRVDLYEWNGEPRVGELTLYNLSGLIAFDPDDADLVLGSWWNLPDPTLRAFRAVDGGELLRELPGVLWRRLRGALRKAH